MDGQRRLHGKRKLAVFVVMLVVVGMLGIAYYESEVKKTETGNAIAVLVDKPLSIEQENALSQQFTRYAPKDNRAPISLVVYTLEDTNTRDRAVQAMNDGYPNLYLVSTDVRKKLEGRVLLEPLAIRYPQDSAVTDDVYYSLQGKEFFDVPELSKLPPCYLALQKSDSYAVTKDVQTQLYYDYQAELLDNIAMNKPVIQK